MARTLRDDPLLRRGTLASILEVIDTTITIEPLPWSVVSSDTRTGTVVVHFLAPVDTFSREHITFALQNELPMTVRLVVTERAPLCTEHPDCWEAGAEMRRACYAATPAPGGPDAGGRSPPPSSTAPT